MSLSGAEVQPEPFRHVAVPNMLARDDSLRLLDDLDTHELWQRRERRGFLRTDQADLSQLPRTSRLWQLQSPAALTDVLEQVEDTFSVHLADRVEFSVLRWTKGCGIGVHTDFGTGQSHRLLVSVAEPDWEASQAVS